MSTDGAAGGSFRRTLWILVSSLVMACLALVAVNLLSGPRLTSVDVDMATVVSSANARLVLTTNRQLSPVTAEQVSIQPTTPFRVESEGNSIVVSFIQPLAYNTDFEVTVRGLTGMAVDRASTLSTTFRTDEPRVLYLNRAVPVSAAGVRADDRILSTTIGAAETDVVFAAPNIQEFVRIGSELAVIAADGNDANALYRVDADGVPARLNLPGVGLAQDLQAAPGRSLLGFRFTSAADAAGPHYENVLFVLDLSTNVATAVRDQNNDPLSVTTWGFLPKRTDIVAQRYDSTLLLVNPLDQSGGNPLETEPEFDPPIPLGQFAAVTAFAPDGVRIAVSDRDGQYVLDLSQGTESSIVPQTVPGTTRYTSELRFFAGIDAYMQRVAEFDASSRTARQHIALVYNGQERTVYAPANVAETIVGFELSPNDQYLAIHIVPNRDTAVSDEYPVNAQSTDASTLFVDITTGHISRSVVGFAATWP